MTTHEPRTCVTGADRDAISNLLGDYCSAFDAVDLDGYAALWTDEGVFSGYGEPVHGHEALKTMVAHSAAQLGDKIRHHLANIVIEHGETHGEATARAYSLVTNWADTPTLFAMVHETFSLRLSGGHWKIAAAHIAFV